MVLEKSIIMLRIKSLILYCHVLSMAEISKHGLSVF